MSEEKNVEIVRQAYDAFERKDIPTILNLLAEDVVWSVAGPADQIPWAGPRHGREGVADFFKALDQALVLDQFEILDYLALDEIVVALGYQQGHTRQNSRPYEYDFVSVWTIQRGKVASFRTYLDTAYVAAVLRGDPATPSVLKLVQALEQVGQVHRRGQ